MLRTTTRLLAKQASSSILNVGHHQSKGVAINTRFSSSANIKAQQEAKARIDEIRRELEVIMDKQEKREEQRGIINAVGRFFSVHKQALFNMFGTFMFVLLAYQLTGMRRGRDQLETKLELSRKVSADKEGILQALQDLEFAQKVARRVIDEIDEPTGWWGKHRLSEEERVALVALVIKQELEGRIGDAGLSEEKKKLLKVKELQRLKIQEQGLEEQQLLNLTVGLLGENAQEVVEETENGAIVVKKRKIMM